MWEGPAQSRQWHPWVGAPGCYRKADWQVMRSKLVSSTPLWLGSRSCFDSLPPLLWRWATSCKLRINHFLSKLLLVMEFYHSDWDPDYNRGIFVSSWIEVHAALPCVWTMLQPSLWAEASLPFSDPQGRFGALMSPAPIFSQHTLHSIRRLCGSAFEQENRPEGLDNYLVSLQPLELPDLSTKILLL